MKTKHYILIGTGILLLIAFLTNPNQEQHKDAMKMKLNSYMQKSISEKLSKTDDELKSAGEAMGMVIGGTLLDVLISNIISIDNYIFFSTTKMTWEGNSKVIGFGIFGNVFLNSKIDKALEDKLFKEQNE